MARICGKPTFSQWFEMGTLMRAFAIVSVAWSVVFGYSVTAPARMFGGYRCTQDCNDHAIGYKWGRVRGIDEQTSLSARPIPFVL